MTLPENIVGGDPGHIGDHNEIHKAINFVNPAVLYVAIDGDDTNDGQSWGNAKATVQAAYDALPVAVGFVGGGGTIIVGPGRYDLGAGLIVTEGQTRPVILQSASAEHISKTSNFNSYSNDVIFYSTLTPVALIKVGGDAYYSQGCAFRGFTCELPLGTKYGILAPHLNYGRFENLTFMPAAGVPSVRQFGIRAYKIGAFDVSWGRINNCFAASMGLGYIGGGEGASLGLQGPNQWTVTNNVSFPGSDPTHCGFKFEQGYRSHFSGNNWEGNGYGLHLINCAGNSFIGDGGEATVTFIKAEGCYGNLFAPLGNVQSGQTPGSQLIDDDGVNQHILPTLTGFASLYGDDSSIGTRVMEGFRQGVHGIAVPNIIKAPSQINYGLPSLSAIDESNNLAPQHTWTIEYWNGSAWAAWAVEPRHLLFPNAQFVDADVAHKKFRLTSTGAFDDGTTLLDHLRYRMIGASTGSVTITFEDVDGGGAVVGTGRTFAAGIDATTRGMWFATGYSGNYRKRITIDGPQTGGDSMRIAFLGIYTDRWEQAAPYGKILKGRDDPEGLVAGHTGDIYQRAAGGPPNTYVKYADDGGLTGWVAIVSGSPAAANADTSGATLAALETEVNELKAILRTFRLLTP